MLNGEGHGPINNLCVPSNVCPSYAPQGKSLISVSVLDQDEPSQDVLRRQVRDQLEDWFGETTKHWRHLRTDNIKYALPNQDPPALSPVVKPVTTDNGVFVCGDHRETASLQGAMASGRRAGEAVVSKLREASRHR